MRVHAFYQHREALAEMLAVSVEVGLRVWGVHLTERYR